MKGDVTEMLKWIQETNKADISNGLVISIQ